MLWRQQSRDWTPPMTAPWTAPGSPDPHHVTMHATPQPGVQSPPGALTVLRSASGEVFERYVMKCTIFSAIV